MVTYLDDFVFIASPSFYLILTKLISDSKMQYFYSFDPNKLRFPLRKISNQE
jgi:hypothetical protein